MLQRLYISNFALISEMEVMFPGALTVITGETGAGKSIFLEALGLALGKRADLPALKNAAKKCVVEAEFTELDQNLSAFFEEQGIEFSHNIILRREISADGKSRSFLNDSPVNLQVLKWLSEKLIDVHSQHETLLLNNENFQTSALDAFAGCNELFTDYRQEYIKLGKLERELKKLEEQEAEAGKEIDYLKFLYDELDAAAVEPGRLIQLEEECARLENAEQIRSTLLAAAYELSGSEENLATGLNRIKQKLQTLNKFGPEYEGFSARLQSLSIDLKDLAGDLGMAESRVLADNEALAQTQIKVDQMNRLLRKHRVKTEEELLAIKNETEEKLSRFESLETTINLIKRQLEKTRTACLKNAELLSKARAKAKLPAETEVMKLLTGLAMPNAKFAISIQKTATLLPGGIDEVEFMFSANKGQELSPIYKAASGGELSRLMLSIKALLAGKKNLPTIIFDEIDSGVSGDVAYKTGNILSQMGNTRQVICITHLPQIACRGKHHLYVYKTEEGEKTVSNIRELGENERITEIAKMMGTGKPSESALISAGELLRNA